MADYTDLTGCRVCGSPYLVSILNLGTPVLSDFMRQSEPDPPRVPLEMVQCDDCDMVQLSTTTDPFRLYVKSYWYRSSVNETMRAELADVVAKATTMVGGLTDRDVVLDIGANDGFLLSRYAGGASEPIRVAYEPAISLYDVLRPHADILEATCFPTDLTAVQTFQRQMKVITSVAVFNHVDNPKAFVEAIDVLLADDGVWVMQVQDLAQMIKATAYDNICHEHVTFDSLKTFEALLKPYDLQVAAVETRAINGGSLRFYVRRRDDHSPWAESVLAARQAEAWLGREALARFAARVAFHKEQLVGTIDYFRNQGAEVDLYAASTKSSTLLQHCGIDKDRIRCAVERTPEKWGLQTSGTRIPVLSEDTWRADPAPVLLIGAWQFADAFKRREAAFLAKGGRMLIPLPQTELVEQRAEAV